MVRTFLCAMVALVICAAPAYTAKPKTDGTSGTIKKIDTDSATLTVTTKVKKQTTDKDFKIIDTTKFTFMNGTDKKEVTGKGALKNDQCKEGATVTVTTDADGAVTGVTVTAAGKKKKTT